MEISMYALISDIVDCQAACNHCFNACLEEKDVKTMAQCIKLNRDCSEICSVVMSFVASESDFAHEVLKLCVDVCEACAAECAKHSYEYCRQCVQACGKCADSCRKYSLWIEIV